MTTEKVPDAIGQWAADGLAADIRMLADVVQEHPDMLDVFRRAIQIRDFALDRARLTEWYAMLRGRGTDKPITDLDHKQGWTKEFVGDYVVYRTHLGNLPLTVTMDREQVCRKVVRGTRTVTIPETTREEVEYEWICSEGAPQDGEVSE